MRADKLAHHCGQRTRVVHDVAAIQEVGVAELLAGEVCLVLVICLMLVISLTSSESGARLTRPARRLFACS